MSRPPHVSSSDKDLVTSKAMEFLEAYDKHTQIVFKKKRIGKRAILKQLTDENLMLKTLTGDLQQKITAIEAQNAVLQQQLHFFRRQIQETMKSLPEGSVNVPSSLIEGNETQ